MQIREAFYAKATEEGTLESDSAEARMIRKLPSYEANAARDSAYAAGQLGADTYEATLPEAIAQYGYRGCVYSLARGLEHRLAPDKGSGG